ncbi:aminotransferase [Melaminivora suipulveris]|uniref:histidinol-phosphate transaminase n=2 Tax=Melaminivora suipulveris TaxID=2109913 RepID=A0A2R3Q8A5_9BURK|nr:aminotransferase class I/II-fold pyridoxal phosphate-dependent enzyme [Melaminivora suipulveris]AVO47904.1 aminotransferase [Melaminivora suipulveris]
MIHGGPDALGVPAHDFSTNANTCGPCPAALAALAQADRSRYPDPAYTDLTQALADFHGVEPSRIVLAASASEFIHRITAFAARSGARQAVVPRHGYGDYARAAGLWGLSCAEVPTEPADADRLSPLPPLREGRDGGRLVQHAEAGEAQRGRPPPQLSHRAGGDENNARLTLHWACEPASPLGTPDAALDGWTHQSTAELRIVDCAYAPLRLHGQPRRLPANAWQMYSPNKALGLTGVRAAYAIAPLHAQANDTAQQLRALAPSWPVGADGVALLTTWTGQAVQRWLSHSLITLRDWKAQQIALSQSLGWHVVPGSLANFFTARLPPDAPADLLPALRAHGIKLRDCSSFGLPGHVRLGVLPPASQQALRTAWLAVGGTRQGYHCA